MEERQPRCLVDITDQLLTSCELLLPGDLEHASWFTLHNAMGAIEIMDPKVDLCVAERYKPEPIVDRIRQGKIFLGVFKDTSALVDIMDELLSYTVNLLCGDSLLQTVFTCVYMHCTQLIADPFLRCFCELLRSSIYNLRFALQQSRVTNEEDYCLFDRGVSLDGPDPRYDFLLDEVESLAGLDKKEALRRLSLGELCAKSQEIIAAKLCEKMVQSPQLSALIDRMRFVKSFAELTYTLSKGYSVHFDKFDGYQHTADPRSLADFVDDRLSGMSLSTDSSPVSQHLDSCGRLCSVILPQLFALRELSRRIAKSSITDADRPSLPSFDPLLNVTQLPALVPQTLEPFKRDKALRYLAETFDEAHAQITWFEQSMVQHTVPMHYFLTFLQRFGQQGCVNRVQLADHLSPTTHSCVLVRLLTDLLSSAVIQLDHSSLETPVDSQSGVSTVSSQLTDLTSSSMMSKASLPGKSRLTYFIVSWMHFEPAVRHAAIEERIASSDPVRSFLANLSEYLSQLPHVYCTNRSRQRTSLHQLLTKLPDILAEASQAEWDLAVSVTERLGRPSAGPIVSALPPYQLHLVSYLHLVYYQLAWDYLAAGFQLDLYTTRELLPVYIFLLRVNMHLVKVVRMLSHPGKVAGDATGQGRLEVNQSCVNSCLAGRTRRAGRKGSGANRKHNQKRPVDTSSSVATTTTSSGDESVGAPAAPSADKVSGSTGPFVLGWVPESVKYEMHYLDCHNFLILGTIYAVRAVQLDTGMDPFVLTQPADPAPSIGHNPLAVYRRRLAIFFEHRNSAFWTENGCEGAFADHQRWFTRPELSADPSRRSAIYAMASVQFSLARQHATQAVEAWPDREPRFAASFGGPSDAFKRLAALAGRNTIACRVLSTCPERRPTQPLCRPFSEPSVGPVAVDFGALTTRAYPEIRLVATPKQAVDSAK